MILKIKHTAILSSPLNPCARRIPTASRRGGGEGGGAPNCISSRFEKGGGARDKRKGGVGGIQIHTAGEADATWTSVLPASDGKMQWMYAVPLQVDGVYGIDLIAASKGESMVGVSPEREWRFVRMDLAPNFSYGLGNVHNPKGYG
ncbi:MAG: hypothetical protein U5K79_03090 [Cyclobacteriaceae bacterium]|nr:hypothetical protein [Cyclobacteriaceae bacterium]